MASSYWESTQRKFWTFTRQELDQERKRIEDTERNLVNTYPLPDRRHLSIYFSHREFPPIAFTISLIFHFADIYLRTRKNGTTTRHTPTSPSNSTSLHPPLLRQNRNPPHESRTRTRHCAVPRVQNGRMPTAHSHGVSRSATLLGYLSLSPIFPSYYPLVLFIS
jgi:hypothetical protein